MSFSIWTSRPPFAEDDLSPGEKIYAVGGAWVVTDDPARATQAEVAKVLNPPPPPAKTVDDRLAAIGLTLADLKAALAK